MKKLLFALLLSFVLVSSVFSAPIVHTQYLATTGTKWTAKEMTTATGTYYSDAIPLFQGYNPNRMSTGYCALLVTSSAGSLAITYEVSEDGTNFYTPVDTSDTSLNSIATAMTVGTKYIRFSPTIAKYIRFKFVDTSANTTVAAQFINLVEEY